MPLASQSEIFSIIRDVSDAAMQGRDWSEGLNRFARAFGAECAVIESIDQAAGMTEVFGALSGFAFSQADAAEYVNRVYALNPRIAFGMSLNEGTAVSDMVMAPKKLRQKSEFFDWLAPRTEMLHCIGAVLENSDDRVTLVGVHGRDPTFTRDPVIISRIESLLPALLVAVRTWRSIQSITEGQALLATLVEHMHSAVAILHPDGSVYHLNPAMTRLVEHRSLFEIAASQRLDLLNRLDVGVFSRALGFARQGFPQAVALTSVDGCTRICRLIPADRSLRLGSSQDSFVAIIVQQCRIDEGDAALLSQVFALTEREIELTLQLCNAMSPRHIADAWGVSIATVKTHLQRVFQKTGTSRQAELVERIYTLLGRS